MTLNSVDFTIVGAQKCGTTALAQFLGEHPEICMARPKEVHLFDDPNYNSDWDRERCNRFYAPYFEHYNSESIAGEASPFYMYLTEAAEELYRYNPQMKLIVLLRDPTDRAISHYVMDRVAGFENLPLWIALILEPFRLWWGRNDLSDECAKRRASFVSRGLYSKQLKRLVQRFPLSQLLILDAGQLERNHDSVLREVFEFLNVDNDVTIPSAQVFKHHYGKHHFLRSILRVLFIHEKKTLRMLFDKLKIDSEKFEWISRV